jgi:TRAP-type mannitol/chloroaromatic compound transport system permease small subunit
MRRLLIFAGLMVLLIIGGGLTAELISSGGGSPLPWKAEQFFLLVGFILFNLIGIAATIAIIVWLLDGAIRRNKNKPTNAPASTNAVTTE